MNIEIMLQYPNDCKPIKVLGIEVTQVYNIKWSFAGDQKIKHSFSNTTLSSCSQSCLSNSFNLNLKS
jgi:hypothetical protein